MGECWQQTHTQHAPSTKTTSMIGLQNGHTQNGEPHSWRTQKKKKKFFRSLKTTANNSKNEQLVILRTHRSGLNPLRCGNAYNDDGNDDDSTSTSIAVAAAV